MSKIHNAIAMLEILSSKRKYKVSELAEKLEISERMVRYYKEELEKSGYYIDSTRGIDGGYQLISDIYFPKLSVSKYDIELLEGIKNNLLESDYPNVETFQNFIDKINGIYNGSQKKFATKNNIENLDDKHKYEIFNESIKNNNEVEIEYLSLDNKKSIRSIDPCEIFKHKDNLYVAAFCKLRGEIRHFEFDRITKIRFE